jgi:NAD dependent epimerase/dehydratase family enzyme
MAAIDRPDWQGVYNITAPQPARMNDFSQSIATALNRPAWLPVPGIALETLLGEGAIVVLQGQQVLPNRLLASDYQFTHPTLSQALKAIV